MAVFQPQQNLALGYVLAHLDINTLNPALHPAADLGHDPFHAGFPQDHMLVSIMAPRDADDKSRQGQQRDYRYHNQARQIPRGPGLAAARFFRWSRSNCWV